VKVKRLSRFTRFIHSFQFRLFAALALMIFTFIPILGYLSYLQGKRVAEAQIEQYALNTATQIAARVQAYLSHHTSNVRLIKTIFEHQFIDSMDTRALVRYFHLLRQDHPDFVNISFGDQSGRFIMVPPQSPEVHKVFDPRIRPWYVGAVQANDVFWTSVYLFASTQQPGITASIPIVDSHDRIVGVCGIDLDLSTFSKFLQRLHIGRNGSAYIIENRSGHVIAHPDLIKPQWDPDQIKLLSACLTDLRKGNKRFGTTMYDNQSYFTTYTDYPDNDWTLGITLPVSDHLQQMNVIKKTTLAMVVVAILLASVVSYLLSRTITTPLKNLQKGIETVSKGHLDYQVSVQSPDVVGALAGAYNQMAASLKNSHEELKNTLNTLAEKEKMAALGQLTAGIAHEIKNPLGIILGSAEVVANTDRPMEMREKAADFIIDEIVRLDKTLKGFLDFAKPSPPRFENADLQKLLAETMTLCSDRLEQKKIMTIKKTGASATECRVDPDQIHQVFMNLIFNAIDAMPDGGRLTVRSWIQVDPQESAPPMQVISIADTGVGIAAEHLKTIFEPFASFKDEGTGLGLAVVKQILKLHQATIDVDSRLNHGTTFTLTFPCEAREVLNGA
jgi:signal transduction histidine kinase